MRSSEMSGAQICARLKRSLGTSTSKSSARATKRVKPRRISRALNASFSTEAKRNLPTFLLVRKQSSMAALIISKTISAPSRGVTPLRLTSADAISFFSTSLKIRAMADLAADIDDAREDVDEEGTESVELCLPAQLPVSTLAFGASAAL